MKKQKRSMDTLCVFTGFDNNVGDEIIVKFSTGALEDAWMGNYELLSDDFVREFRRIDRHCHKGETLMTVLRRDMGAKDRHVSRPAEFIWDQIRYQVKSCGNVFYETPSQASRDWQYDCQPYFRLCSQEEANGIF